MDHVHLSSTVHLWGRQWLPIHIVKVSLTPLTSTHIRAHTRAPFICRLVWFSPVFPFWLVVVVVLPDFVCLVGRPHLVDATTCSCCWWSCFLVGWWTVAIRVYFKTVMSCKEISHKHKQKSPPPIPPPFTHPCWPLLHWNSTLSPQLFSIWTPADCSLRTLTVMAPVFQTVCGWSEGRTPPSSVGHDSRHPLHPHPGLDVHCESRKPTGYHPAWRDVETNTKLTYVFFLVGLHAVDALHEWHLHPHQLCGFHQLRVLRGHYRRADCSPCQETQHASNYQGADHNTSASLFKNFINQPVPLSDHHFQQKAASRRLTMLMSGIINCAWLLQWG